MQPNILSAIIVGLCTIIGVIIGAIMQKTNLLDWLSLKGANIKLPKRLESSWNEITDGQKLTYKEIFQIQKQKGTKIIGKITMESEPDKEWELEGIYNGRFLQLLWYPSKNVGKKFMDYGCYFFEERGDYFEGYAVGYDWQTNKIEKTKHILRAL